MSTISLESTVVRSADQVSTDLGGEVVILDMQSEEYFSLDGVGTRIWEMIQESRTVQEILDTILSDYAVEPERCERDLLAVLQELADEGLVEIK